MNLSRSNLVAVSVGAIVIVALLLSIQPVRDSTSATLRTASHLLSVHQAMTKDGLSGFLPGNHSRLGDGLWRKRFTSVTILPDMVIGAHSMTVAGARCGRSVVLLKDSEKNAWTVWRNVHIGRWLWRSKVGTIHEPRHAPSSGSSIP